MSQQPIPSASLIVLSRLKPAADPTTHDYRVLLLKRAASKTSSYGSAWVFPGGALEVADADERWSSSSSRAGGQAGAPESSSLALKICALRETFEESGLLLCEPASGPGSSESARRRAPQASWRERVNADPAAFLELFLRERGDWPAISALQTRARWVTPARSQSKRFDASFFCAILPAHDAGAAFAQEAGRATTTTTTMGSEEQGEGHQATSDGVETVEAAWLSPAELVERAARDPEAMRLLPPQLYLLAELANAPQLDALLDLSDLDARGMPRVRARKVVKLLPELKVVDDLGGERRRAVVLPGDCEHGETQSSSSWPAREDRRRRLHRVFVKITDGSMMAAQGVVRHNVDDVLGHGWQNMQAGDVGELKSHL